MGLTFGILAGLPDLPGFFDLVRVSWFLAGCGALLLLCLWAALRRGDLPPRRAALPPGLLLVGLIALTLLVVPSPTNGYLVGQQVALLLLGSSLLLSLSWKRPSDDTGARSDRTRIAALGLSLVTLAVLSVAQYKAFMIPGGIDETLYVLQSRMLREPHFGRLIDPDLSRFFVLRQMAVVDGRLLTQYPPGWPALLAVAQALGMRWLAVPALMAASVWLTYAVAAQVTARRSALVAAALVASAPLVIQHGGVGYWSHAATLVAVLGGTWCFLAGLKRGSLAVGFWLAAGACYSVGVLVRPITGAALGVSAIVWALVLRQAGFSTTVRSLGSSALGALPAGLALLAYNAATTGSPFRFGYQAANNQLHNLGFGIRGFTVYAGDGIAKLDTFHFGVSEGVSAALQRFWDAGIGLFPGGGVVVVMVAAAAAGFRWRSVWPLVIPFLLLPLVHFFYFYSTPRFYIELVPFGAIGLAALLHHTALRHRGVQLTILAFLVAGGVTAATGRLAQSSQYHAVYREAYREVERAADKSGNVIVFVSDPRGDDSLLDYLYWQNIDHFPGRIVVARDLGGANEALLRALPGYTPLRIRWRALRAGVVLEAAPATERPAVGPLHPPVGSQTPNGTAAER